MRHGYSALCLAATGMIVTANLAYSADMTLRSTIADPAMRADWTGAYAGIHAGALMSDGGVKLGRHFGVLIPLDVDNGLFFKEKSERYSTIGAGMTLGYNQQFGSMVVGVEGDITFTTLDADHNRQRIDPNPLFPFFGQNVISDYKTRFEDLMTLRLRAGATLGDTLFYATGGVAAAQVENSFAIAIPGLGYASPDWSESGLAWGYTVGGGIEHKLGRNVSVKAEVLYTDLEDRTVKGRDPVSFAGEGINYEFENKLTTARLGLNYAF